jgi:hypothetical protein
MPASNAPRRGRRCCKVIDLDQSGTFRKHLAFIHELLNRGLAMTNHVTENNALTKKSNAVGFDKIVIGILILGFAALVIYQLFFCATCYGTSIH